MIRLRPLLLILVLFALSARSDAQRLNNRWYFGNKGGLDFNSDPPVAFKNKLTEFTAPPNFTATICDPSGRLMFMTDGFNLWDKKEDLVFKKNARWPFFMYDKVIPLFCPAPGSDSLFHLFMVGTGTSPNNRHLVSVMLNTRLNAGNGGIVYPDPLTSTNYYTDLSGDASLLAGTAHCNQQDYWITTISGGALKSFLISSSGIATAPVVTALPPGVSDIGAGFSNIKFSAGGEKFLLPMVNEGKILVLDFNNFTGSFSNPLILPLPPLEILQDAEFSPSGRKLYYCSFINETNGPEYTGVELHDIYQLNLEAGSPGAIQSSRYKLNSFPDRGGCPRSCFILNRTLNLGPDGRIYANQRQVNESIDKKINVIAEPERSGAAATYIRNYVDIGVVYGFININYIRSESFTPEENGILVRKKTCLGLPTDFSLVFTRIDSVKWNFGDPASAGNLSTSAAPSHTYTATGTYTVQAIIYKNCYTDTASIRISIDPDPIVRIPEFIKDTVLCTGSELYLDAKMPGDVTYQWETGLIYSYRTIKDSGTYSLKAYNSCSSDSREFTVTFKDCPCEMFIPSAFSPNNDGRNDEFRASTTCLPKDFRFIVFNRYGNKVFSSFNPSKGWNGRIASMDAPSDVYVWMLSYRDPNTGASQQKKGTVTLIR